MSINWLQSKNKTEQVHLYQIDSAYENISTSDRGVVTGHNRLGATPDAIRTERRICAYGLSDLHAPGGYDLLRRMCGPTGGGAQPAGCRGCDTGLFRDRASSRRSFRNSSSQARTTGSRSPWAVILRCARPTSSMGSWIIAISCPTIFPSRAILPTVRN